MAATKKFLPYAFFTGLLAGTMDLCGAVINYVIAHGNFPYKILEYIASGAFGKTAMDGSTASNLWGLFFHYFIAMSFTLFYFYIYPRVKFLQKNVLLSAVLYGIFVWCVMNLAILPLLKIAPVPTKWDSIVRGAVILMFCIGLPISLIVSGYYLSKVKR